MAHETHPLSHIRNRRGRCLPALLSLWLRNATTRRHLARATPEILPDIGVSPAEVRAEVRKPFWK